MKRIIDREAKVLGLVDFLNSYITMQKLTSKSAYNISYGYKIKKCGLIEMEESSGYYSIEFSFYNEEFSVYISDYMYGDINDPELTFKLTLKKSHCEVLDSKIKQIENLFYARFSDTSEWGNHLKEIDVEKINHDYAQKQFIKLINILNKEITK